MAFQPQETSIEYLPSHFTLLHTKFTIPPVPPLFIPRPRFISQLDKIWKFKVSLISAPTGFGKTTLLSEWASQSSRPVLWLSLNESDSNSTYFWSYFLHALVRLAESPGATILESSSLVPSESILIKATNILATIPQEFVLILDNYHTIRDSQVHQALAQLIEYLPAHMHIAIVSRTRPALPLARLRAYQQLYELHPVDLLFTQEETTAFFAQTLGREIPSPTALALFKGTDGWVAILQLVAAWLQEQKDGWEALARIHDSHRYILDYLATEVLQQQPRAMQLFLLQTSILEQFNSSLCDAVTGQNNAPGMLEQIEQAHLLITPLDTSQGWYNYHQVFKTFLRQRLEQIFPNLVLILHRRACAWYEQQKRSGEAISYALSGQDFEKAAELILKNGEKMLVNGEANTLLTWLKALPEEIVCLYPPLCLFYAWSLMVVGQFDAAEVWIRNIDYLYKKVSFIPDVETLASLEQKENDAHYIQSVIAVLRAHIAIFWGDISHVADFTRQAQTSLAGANLFIQSLNTLNIGVVDWLNGDIVPAEKAFAAVAVNGKRLNNAYITLAADCGLMLTSMLQGKRHGAYTIARQALQFIATHKSYLSPFSVYLYTETSYLLYEWNRLDEATRYAQEALKYGEQQDRDILVYSYTILSRIALARGNLDKAVHLLQQAESNIPYSQQRPWIVSRMAEHRVNLALALGDFQQADFWSRLPELEYFGSLAIILRMRVFLAKNQPCEALELMQEYARQSQEDIMPLILQALAYQELGNLSEALHTLDRVLLLTEPEGYIRFFLDEGSKLARLLRVQLERYERQRGFSWTRFGPYLQQLLDAFAQEASVSPPQMEEPARLPGTADIIDPLSERELDVLRGILAGLSNQEIAQQMVVAESTVKWHIKNVYSKLQVHNRAQAIIKARKIQL